MALSDEKLDKIISLLEEGNHLRDEALRLSREAAQKTDEIVAMNKEMHGSYKKHAVPVMKLMIPMTVFIVVVVLILLLVLFGVFRFAGL